MRVKDCAARQIEELPFEQIAGTSSNKGEVVEFRSSVVCSGTVANRFLDGMADATRRRLLERINERFENDATPVLVARDGKRQLIAFKLSESNTAHHGAAVGLADLNDIPVPNEHVLQRVFDLTNAEVRLAQGAARGDSLEEVAAELGIKISTARTQLASIFAKTQTRRQAKLVALLGRLAQLGA
jgi:DNA-binding CsgD family transcriptional regulator